LSPAFRYRPTRAGEWLSPDERNRMHRYLITPLAGVECDPPAPWTADAVESKVSDVSLLDGVSSHLTAQLSGSARVDEREVWRVDCLSGDSMEVFTVLALIDRVPDENERERYASHGETRKRQPSDTGGRSPGKGKSRSPQPRHAAEMGRNLRQSCRTAGSSQTALRTPQRSAI